MLVQPLGHVAGHPSYYTRCLCEGLLDLGHEVVVVTHHGFADDWTLREGRRVVHFQLSTVRQGAHSDGLRGEAVGTVDLSWAHRVVEQVRFYRFVRRTAQRERAEITHYIDFSAAAWAVAGLSSVTRCREVFTIPTSAYLTGPVHRWYRPSGAMQLLSLFCVLALKRTVFHSEGVRDHFRRLRLLRMSACIPWGIEDRRKSIERADARERLGIPDGAFVVLFFGQLRRNKGAMLVAELLESRLASDRVFFTVAGPPVEDDVAKRLRSALAKNPDSAWARIGYVDEEEKDLLFTASDVVLLPYEKDAVFASGVLSVSVSHSRLVVTSEFGQIRDIVEEHRIGRFFSPYSISALADVLLALADETEWERRNWDSHLTTFMEQNSWRRVAEQHVKFYEA